jgi:MFS family permease
MTPDALAVSAPDESPKQPSLWRNRDYIGWWVGETVSDYGSSLSFVAYPLLMLLETGSAAFAGIVGAAGSVGMLVTMLIGGALADRYSRRVILTVGPLLEALAVGTVVFAVATHHVTVVHVASVGFIQGVLSGLTSGAVRPAMRRIVPAGQLPTAFAQLQGRSMAIRLAGPPSGGFLFSIARWVPFLVDTLSFLASTIGVLLIRRPLGPDAADPTESASAAPTTSAAPKSADPANDGAKRESIVASIAAGLRFIRGNAYLRYLTVWTAVMNATLTGLMLLVIVLIRDRGGSPTLVGAVNSIGAAGGLIGAFLAVRIAKRMHGRSVVLVTSWVVVVVFVGIALVPAPWQVGLMLALLLIVVGPINVIFATYETRMIPDALSGRVSNAVDFGASTLQWLGPLGGGLLAAAYGPSVAMLLFVVPVAVIAVSAHLASGLHVLDRSIDEIGVDGDIDPGPDPEVLADRDIASEQVTP